MNPATAHFTLEFACGCLGLLICAGAGHLYLQSGRQGYLFWLTMWGLIMGGLSIVHSITCAFPPYQYPISHWFPVLYIPERMLDSLIAVLCVFPECKYRWLKGPSFILLVIIITVLAIFYGWIHTGCDSGGFGRPQEWLQIVPALIIWGQLKWVKTPWGKIMKWGVMATLLGGFSMLFSREIYDAMFFLAHGFKVVSYVIMGAAVMYLDRRVFCGGRNA